MRTSVYIDGLNLYYGALKGTTFKWLDPMKLTAAVLPQRCVVDRVLYNHSAEEWVVGDVHTNSIESVWSLFKRSIIGAFHKMSVKHTDRYLEELEWRFNNRDNPHIFRDTLERIVRTDPLTYDRLVGKDRMTTGQAA